VPRGAKSRMCRTETPKPIWIKFCTVVDITDIVIYTNFRDHRLRVFLGGGLAGGQISPFPIDFDRRPYNTLALPCECVIYLLTYTTNRKYHMAYLFVSFPMTLDDLEGHSPNAGLIKCNSTNICATFSMVLTATARHAVPRR